MEDSSIDPFVAVNVGTFFLGGLKSDATDACLFVNTDGGLCTQASGECAARIQSGLYFRERVHLGSSVP